MPALAVAQVNRAKNAVKNSENKEQKDSLPSLSSWILEDGYLMRSMPFDTVLPRFHIYNDIEKNNTSVSFLGNIGSGYTSNIFFNNLDLPFTDFLPENQFAEYLLTPQKQKFYFSPTPYAEIKYFMSTKKWNENNLHVLYTQNINKKFNYGIRYDLQSGDGMFPQSKVSEPTLNFFIGYTGDKYSIYAALIRNKFRLQESGGIEITGITDPNLTKSRIDGAFSQLYKFDFFISQEYKFGYTKTKIVDDTLEQKIYQPVGKLNYVFNYEHNYRTYFDDDTLSNVYRDILISKEWTTDSINLKKWDNSVFWTFNNISYQNAEVLNSVGAVYEIIGNYTFKGYVWKPQVDYYHNIKTVFKSVGTFKKFLYRFDSYYYLSGYKQNDFRALLNLQRNFTFRKSPAVLSLTMDLYQREPAFMEQFYYTNHFIWNNNFDKKNVLRLNMTFQLPNNFFKVKLDAANLANYIYFDSLAYPVQAGNSFRVYSASIEKEFNFGKFSSMNKVIGQYSDNNEVVSIPKYIFYHSLYFNYWYKTALHLHLGYEIYYSAEFDALSYAPVTGQFYLGKEMKTGSYPILNMYLDMRVQSVLLFFKFENISFQFLNDDFYYPVSYYPMNTTMFKFGVAWRFKN
jgi:hypothetical protein